MSSGNKSVLAAEAAVLDELKALRKREDAGSVAAIAEQPVLCQLLGNGDPALAQTQFQHLILTSELTTAIKAAAFSLGFASSASTHLQRLDDFANEQFIEQRQARRYSDRGIKELARLICTNWLTHGVPVFDCVLTPSSDSTVMLFFAYSHPDVLDMSRPSITVQNHDGETEVAYETEAGTRGGRMQHHTYPPLTCIIAGETTITVLWKGEVWPKFGLELRGSASGVGIRTLGAKMQIALWPDFVSTAAHCERIFGSSSHTRLHQGGHGS